MKNNQDAFKIEILNESLLNLSEISRVINGCFVRRTLNNRNCLVKTMLLMTILAHSDNLISFCLIINVYGFDGRKIELLVLSRSDHSGEPKISAKDRCAGVSKTLSLIPSRTV